MEDTALTAGDAELEAALTAGEATAACCGTAEELTTFFGRAELVTEFFADDGV